MFRFLKKCRNKEVLSSAVPLSKLDFAAVSLVIRSLYISCHPYYVLCTTRKNKSATVSPVLSKMLCHTKAIHSVKQVPSLH